MPKIVDREMQSNEIASKAVEVFIKKGYSGVGMRELAAALGLSKSALYHYFPSKAALFMAAGEIVTKQYAKQFIRPSSNTPSTEELISAVVNGVRKLDPYFKGEILLVTDYLRHFSTDQARQDPAIAGSNATIFEAISSIVGAQHAESVMIFCYGFMLQRMLDGGQSEFDTLERGLNKLLEPSTGI